MMNTYRPDLARTLSTADLLALRYDATISREMVRNLAREGEAYLRARGHQITAGRLYLCHFLGMEGAHQVLSAPGSAQLSAVSGVGRHPGQPVSHRQDSQLRGGLGREEDGPEAAAAWPPMPARRRRRREIRQTSPEFEKYKQAVTALISSIQNTL